MANDYCICCQKVTIHNREEVEWYGNKSIISIRLVCSECNCQNSMWLENINRKIRSKSLSSKINIETAKKAVRKLKGEKNGRKNRNSL